jgi:Xaa-Pro dipeptidase/ectoine hydrolase
MKIIFIRGPKHPYDYLVEIIKERKWDKLSVGVEMDAHYYTAFCHEKIKQGLPMLQS